jgi:hypothetical protein
MAVLAGSARLRSGKRAAESFGMGLMLATLASLAGSASATDVRRCEDPQGHITYSNESCPSGTAHERAVDNRPAVEVPSDSASAKAARGGKLENSVPSSAQPVTSNNPEQTAELASEQRKSQVARCDDLVRRIEYAQQDLLSAGASERASIELGLRRLQEEHKASCIK